MGKAYVKSNIALLLKKVTKPNQLSRSHLNITYKQEPLPMAYDKLFGDGIKTYNAKQKKKRQTNSKLYGTH